MKKIAILLLICALASCSKQINKTKKYGGHGGYNEMRKQMKPYTKAYLKHHGYDVSDFIPCVCGARSVDIHHIEPRSKRPDLLNDVSNLIALCRSCHEKAERDKEFNQSLKYANQISQKTLD